MKGTANKIDRGGEIEERMSDDGWLFENTRSDTGKAINKATNNQTKGLREVHKDLKQKRMRCFN